MTNYLRFRNGGGLAMLCALLGTLCKTGSGQIRYSVPEELDEGSFVGNIAKDLGLEPRELAERGVRIVSRGRTQLFALNPRSGSLVTVGRIDREELCAQSARCLVKFNILVEDKLKIFEIEIEIQDINDNAPDFLTEELEIKIGELTVPGTPFPLKTAFDPDVGMNSLQNYQLSPNDYFSLSTKESPDGSKYPELLLEKPLDREQQSSHRLILTAMDGGDPPLSGTTQIRIQVTDANDNAPVFSQNTYRVRLQENVPRGTSVLQVKATDQDEGIHAEITYAFLNAPVSTSLLFNLNPNTGDITTNGTLDFEETNRYMLAVEAKDGGVHTAHCSVQIDIVDENDNAPEVTFMSFSNQIPEDTDLGTVIALIKVRDQDSGQNGLVTCYIQEEVPFKLESTSKNYYKLMVDSA
ncbi:PREDICTED: protocadherin gamma-B1-like, partial [Hipposideros armiger]|uniref:Protocadherin gamma-B1-like n=1 Tax=Hipposideros armiger TaxID=186990 RepID=A0A8B7SV84_HIPAR